MDGLYNIDELANSFVEEFALELDGDGYCIARYKQSIRRAMERLGILNNYVELRNAKTGYLCNYYSAQQRELIKGEPKFHDYLLNNSSEETIRNGLRSKEIQKAIETRREKYIEYLSQQECETNDERVKPLVSSEELRQRKLSMMIEALFNRWFTEFDEGKLLNDMNLVLQEDELGLSPDQIEAEERLSHPEGAYYKRKSEEPEEPKP